jgi:photosystem II stability/assembly factor-like uncharacterized protein
MRKAVSFSVNYVSVFFLLCLTFKVDVVSAQWTTIDTVNTKYTSIYFVNDTMGFLGGKGYYKKTDDGGNTWSVKVVGGPNDEVQKMYFIDSSRGFLGGYYMGGRTTTDGGNTWDTLTNFTFPFCFAENNRYGFSSVYSPFGNPYPTFRSSDYGQSWQMIAWVQPDANATITGIRGIHFADSLHGMIVAGQSHLFVTNDGGNTWNLKKPLAADHDLNDVYMLNATTAYIIAREDNPFAIIATKVLRTDDGGDTWNIVSTVNYEVMTKIQFVDSQKGFMCSNRWFPHKLLSTTDGGASWQEDSVRFVIDFSIADGSSIFLLTWDSVLTQKGSVLKRDLESSVKKTLYRNNIELYPNPASVYFDVKLVNHYSELKSLSILTIDGKLEKKINITDSYSNIRISCGHLSKGMYVAMFQFATGEKIFRRLFVI